MKLKSDLVRIDCTLRKFGIPIYYKSIYIDVGKSIDDYNMGFWWDFMWKFSSEEDRMIADVSRYEQKFDEKQNKIIIRRRIKSESNS